MKLEIIPVTPLQQNCSLLICETTNKAALVDPGGDPKKLKQRVEALGVEPEKLLLTHGHFDHAGAANELAKYWNIPIVGPHKDDQFLTESITEWCEQFGMEGDNCSPDQWLEQGDKVSFGEVTLEVLHCPGHTPGHIVFVNQQAKLAFVGDVIFNDGIGRTDFPRGNHAQLIDSIKNRLFPLGEEIEFVPGHGPTSTFGKEIQSNPFIR